MNRIATLSALAALIAAAAPTAVLAGPKCDVPKAEWMKEADFKAKVAADGYTIKTFKVSDGCYEIYGTDKAGKKVEIYFDPKTGAPVVRK